MSKALANVPVDPHALCISDIERLAAPRMTLQTASYYNDGADSGTTLRENISAFSKYRIRPRVLRDISVIDTSVEIFGHKNTLPLGVAPTAMQCLAHPDGEKATARASRKAGIIMGLSSFATTTLEEVADESQDNPNVLQLYLFEEREHSRKLIARAKKAGYKAVFLTVDTPVLGRRNLDIRNKFTLPKPWKIANFEEDNDSDAVNAVMSGSSSASGGSSAVSESTAGYHDGTKRVPPSGKIRFHTHAPNPTLNWERDIAWLKQECGPEMQVWVKGIATAEDTELAIHYGVDGIVVSNHGGRQLDGALATLDALPEVVEAAKGRVPVHVDGGVRHGTDIFKALALGCDMVWIGRPVLWSLAYRGQEGVELCLALLAAEFERCMALAGVTSVSQIDKSYLVKMDAAGFPHKL
ncbi:hypothetical protein PYCC9005_000630 [Savitreella phatthalungensis]